MKQPLRSTPMQIPPREVERQFFQFTIAASDKPTTVRIEVSAYSGDGDHQRKIEPLLGDGLVPPNHLCFAGNTWELEPMEWKLLDLLTHTYEKRLPVHKVLNALWPDKRRANEKNLNKVKSVLNAKLISIGYWFTVRTKAKYVILE